jgi:hypothetical protein
MTAGRRRVGMGALALCEFVDSLALAAGTVAPRPAVRSGERSSARGVRYGARRLARRARAWSSSSAGCVDDRAHQAARPSTAGRRCSPRRCGVPQALFRSHLRENRRCPQESQPFTTRVLGRAGDVIGTPGHALGADQENADAERGPRSSVPPGAGPASLCAAVGPTRFPACGRRSGRSQGADRGPPPRPLDVLHPQVRRAVRPHQRRDPVARVRERQAVGVRVEVGSWSSHVRPAHRAAGSS